MSEFILWSQLTYIINLNLFSNRHRGPQEAVSLKGVASYSFQQGVAGPERWISVKVLVITVYETKLGCFYFHSEHDVAIRLAVFVTRPEYAPRVDTSVILDRSSHCIYNNSVPVSL